MTQADLSPKTRDFYRRLNQAERDDPPMYLAVLAFLCSNSGGDYTELIRGYTRGDFKRAIRRLREVQKHKPEFPPRYIAAYEETIAFIRKEWLHRTDHRDAGQIDPT